MRSILVLTFLILVSSCVAGCATIFGDKGEQINIHSNDQNAKILVNGNQIGRGAATYYVPAGKPTMITASKKGCSDTTTPTGETIRGATFLDIFFWPTIFIDLATGALHKTDPVDYTVTPNCSDK